MPTTEYDISRAFKRIENDLIDSMMRNLKRHRAEEDELGIKWEQWQALQLKELERYRAENAEKFSGEFTDINRRINEMLNTTYNDAQTEEERKVLEHIKQRNFTPTISEVSFFNLNDEKLNVLLERTQADFTRAEYAVLRRANDAYRRVIFDAQVYANVTNDYNRAVDMATHDFLKSGLQSIQYKNGARHNISDYARMAIRTTNKRAYLMGEGNAHDKFGIHTVRVNRRTQACPLCVGYLGKVLIDDVYSGGTAKEASELGVPTLSSAMQAGFLHPNCKDIYSLYIDGVSQPAKPWTQQEINDIVGDYNEEQAIKHAVDMATSYARMAKYALDPLNAQKYQARADNWQARIDEIKNTPPTPVEPPVPVVVQSSWDRNNVQYSKAGQSVKDSFERWGAQYNQAEKWEVQPTEEEIIKYIAGGDRTNGSCVSVACAYIGNKVGLNVRDFRGGASCDVMQFSNRNLARLTNVIAIKEEGDLIRPAKKLLAQMEEGKQYLMITGRHGSIVRVADGQAQYLELQSAYNNGWKDFGADGKAISATLRHRFGCYGKSAGYSYLMDIESFKGSDEFRDLLGYINTAEDKQRKGVGGGIK